MSILIHSQIDEIDEIASEAIADEGTAMIDNQAMLSTHSMVQGSESVHWGKVFIDGHIKLHLYQPPAKLLSFEDNFHQCLATWLTSELNTIGVPLLNAIVFGPEDNVSATPVSLQIVSLNAI